MAVQEIQLKNFKDKYQEIIHNNIDSKLLFKCLSDYDYKPLDDSVCFRIANNQIKDKNGAIFTGISYAALPEAYKNLSNNQIKFSDINNKFIASSNNVSLTFMDDWKDLRTSLGSIPIQGNNGYTMSGITSDNIQYFKDKFKTDIEDNHDNILRKRNSLDNKMRELYGQPNDADFNSETSIYTTMLFTVLTTSLLYFLFTKM
jgi:hypothetical protein